MRECGECGEKTSLGSGGTADAIVDAGASRISQNYDGGSVTFVEIQEFKLAIFWKTEITRRLS